MSVSIRAVSCLSVAEKSRIAFGKSNLLSESSIADRTSAWAVLAHDGAVGASFANQMIPPRTRQRQEAGDSETENITNKIPGHVFAMSAPEIQKYLMPC